MTKLLSNPGRVRRLFTDTPPHFYHLEADVPRVEMKDFIIGISGADAATVDKYLKEIRDHDRFVAAIEDGFAKTAERPDNLSQNWREMLYALVRAKEPDTIVETGVYDGLSSAYILQAISDAGYGHLVSIDINDTTYMPTDLPMPDVNTGWLVPECLQSNWNLKYGDARELLPKVVEQTPPTVFLHDSLHTKEHMLFEFETAIESMGSGNVLLSDNVMFNDAFETVADQYLRDVQFLNNTTETITHEGKEIDDRFGGGVVR
ncbi:MULTISPECIES: class I SAM-dependent methyltransferase [Haloarcula]|uniref:class I SAM-dependent methyltransferase n=1 Tax=Haloarcula TaxID=2237 RepID=UPI000F8C7734|nr:MULTISPECIES: class I SAM-dependent methyltransferase [Haloarcula]NHX41495.1 class I SAM-dependent methyltransferase [Haloarcula sp. R1-2]